MKRFIGLVLLCLLLASCGFHDYYLIPMRRYVAPQGGMFPNLPAKSSFWVMPKPYVRPEKIERGDIIVYHATREQKQFTFIWRVIGLPGDRVILNGTDVTINGVLLSHKRSEDSDSRVIFTEQNGTHSYLVAYDKNPAPERRPDIDMEVPEGEFFVLGDNRDHAWDGRFTGTVPFEKVIGKKW